MWSHAVPTSNQHSVEAFNSVPLSMYSILNKCAFFIVTVILFMYKIKIKTFSPNKKKIRANNFGAVIHCKRNFPNNDQ